MKTLLTVCTGVLLAVKVLAPDAALAVQLKSPLLRFRQPLTRKLTGARPHEYRIALKSGELIQVRVEQRGIDVVLSVHSSNGKSLASVDSPNGAEGPEIISFVAPQTGNYYIGVSRLDDSENAASGRYSITLTARRVPTSHDLKRITAERQMYALSQSTLANVGDIQPQIDHYESLLAVWQQVGDKYVAGLIEQVIVNLKQLKSRLEAEAKEDTAKQHETDEAKLNEARKRLRSLQVEQRKEAEAKRSALAGSPQLIVESGHSSAVNSIAFSPDGKLIVSGSDDHTVKIWSTATVKELRTLKGHAQPVVSVAFSPDGTKVASVSGDAVVMVWDVATGRILNTHDEYMIIDFYNSHLNVLFSPDGRKLQLKSDVEMQGLWDVASGRELPVTSNGAEYIKPSLSANWELLAAAETDNSIRVWSVELGTELARLKGHPGEVQSLTFSTDGRMLASTGADKIIRLWDLAASKSIKTLDNCPAATLIKFSPDGKRFVTACGKKGADFTLKLWDASTLEEVSTLPAQVGELISAEFSTDGRTLTTLSSIGVSEERHVTKTWDLTTHREFSALEQHPPFNSDYNTHLFSPGLKSLVLFKDYFKFRENAFEVWDLERNQIHRVAGHRAGVVSVTFAPNGETVASCSEDGTVKLWEVTTGREISTLAGRVQEVRRVKISPDGKTLILELGLDNDIKLWNVESGQAPKVLHFEGDNWDPWSETRLSPDGRILATLTSFNPVKRIDPDGSDSMSSETAKNLLKFWDVTSGQEVKLIKGEVDDASSIAFSPDGKLLAVVNSQKVISVWNLATGRVEHSLTDEDYMDVVFSPKGSILAAITLRGITLWDVRPGKRLRMQKIERGGVDGGTTRIVFSPDEKTMASASRNEEQGSSLKLWNLASGRQLRALENTEPVSESGTSIFNSIEFSPDGKMLAALSEEYTATADGESSSRESYNRRLKLWDVTSGKPVRSFDFDAPGTAREVYALVPAIYLNNEYGPVTPDGQFQIKPEDNGRVSIYELRTGRLLADLVTTSEAAWVTVTPDGRFDTNQLDDPKGLHWLLPKAPFNPLSFEVFMKDYFEPKLLPRLLKCTREYDCDREFKTIRDLSSLNRTQPEVRIINITPTASPDVVEVSVEARNVVGENQKDARGERLSSGVFDVRLFRDGQLIGHTTSDENLRSTFRAYENFNEELAAWQKATRVKLVDGRQTFTFRVTLPRRADARQVEFSAYAFNEDRVKSETHRVDYTVPNVASRESRRRTAFLIAVGVNKYDNAEWDLQFAGADARVTLEVISATLRKGGEFAEVVEVPLISDDESDGGRQFERRDATKANVETVLGLLAGRTPSVERLESLMKAVGTETLQKLRPSGPDDLILLSLSSHGYANKNGVFYIIPTDIGPNHGRKVTEQLLNRSISSDELSLWLRDVDAGEMLMIVDACHAASAVEGSEFKPGPMGSRGLGQLAFDKGMRILTATQADNVALENKFIRQGLLTYALIRDGIEARQADYRPKDKVIGVGEWLSYGVERVPKLYEEAQGGMIQGFGGGTRRQTKVVITATDRRNYDKELKEVMAGARIQQPSLFDFKRSRQEVTLSVLP